MKIREFIEVYCADLKELYANSNSILSEDVDLPYDDEIEDDSGTKMKVVYAGDTPIPVTDIVTLDREGFIKIYPSFECREMYDRYIDSLIILDGEEALNHIRNSMRREREKLDVFKQRNSMADMLC